MLARLKDAARGALGRANAGDRLWLVTADSRVVGGGGAGAVRAALDRTEPLGGAGDLRAAVARATQLVRGGGLPSRQIALLTDAQATSWTAAVPLDGVATTLFAPALVPPKNRSVVSARAEPPHWTPRGVVRATTTTTDSVTFRVALGARAAARGIVAPGEEIAVRLAPAERGWLAGAVELEPDELRGDDVRWFAVHVGSAPGVSPNPEPARSRAPRSMPSRRRAASRVALTWSSPARSRRAARRVLRAGGPGAARRRESRARTRRNSVEARRGAQRAGAGHGTGLSGVNATAGTPSSHGDDRGAGQRSIPLRARAVRVAVAGDGYVLVASPLSSEATDLPVARELGALARYGHRRTALRRRRLHHNGRARGGSIARPVVGSRTRGARRHAPAGARATDRGARTRRRLFLAARYPAGRRARGELRKSADRDLPRASVAGPPHTVLRRGGRRDRRRGALDGIGVRRWRPPRARRGVPRLWPAVAGGRGHGHARDA